jgi:hypothetical protein
MITLEQARKTLPDGYQITDEELASVIADAYLIANFAISDYLRSKQKKEGGQG